MFGWECWRCGGSYEAQLVRYLCPKCSVPSALSMRLDPVLSLSVKNPASILTQETSMWRYRAFLPLADGKIVEPLETTYHVGGTPLVETPRLATAMGVGRIWIKDEGRNPTASLKDRASALVVAAAARAGTEVICTASSGNAAAALAGCCAVAGIACVVFVPIDVAQAKVSQLLAYGAHVLAVRGGYEAAVQLSYEAADRYGWLCRSTAYNPLTAEGKKTVALEITEQLGWRTPDVVLVPTGDGNILTAVYRGFSDALRVGWIDSMPRLVAVQSERAPAIYEAWARGLADVEPHSATSLAESINVAIPQDGFRALRAIRETHGLAITVADADLSQAVKQLASLTGIFAEPSAAISVPALARLRTLGEIGPEDEVVLINTGSGLKHQLAVPTNVALINANLSEVSAALKDLKNMG